MAERLSLKADNEVVQHSFLRLFADQDGVRRALDEGIIFSIKPGEVFAKEGRVASDLILLLSGSAQLASQSIGANVGPEKSISRFEAVNLSAVVEGEAHPFSAAAIEATTILLVPQRKITALLERQPQLRAYLRWTSQYRAIKDLASTLSDLGISEAFQVALVGALKEERVSPESWIVRPGETVKSSFLVHEGSVQCYRKPQDGPPKPLWMLPAMQWQLWEEALLDKVSEFGFKAVDAGHLFRLELAVIRKLQADYPKDYPLFADFAARKTTPVEKEDGADGEEGEEVPSLENLFPKLPRNLPWFRFRYPFVRQHDVMDCAAACLTMISQYHGNDIPIRYWRDRLGTDLRGTSMFGISQTAERAGFATHGLRLESLDEVNASLLPMIALRRDHFMVVYARKRKYLIVGDPAVGIRNIPIDEFNKQFEGYAILMAPTERFYKTSALKVGWGHFLEILRGHGREMTIIAVCSFLLVFLGTIPAFMGQVMFDEVLSKKDVRLLVVVMGASLLMSLIISLTSALRTYFISYLASKMDFVASSGFMRKLFSLPYEFISSRHVGDFTSRLGSVEQIREFLTGNLIGIVLNFLNIGLYSVILFYYNPVLAGVALVAGPLLLLTSTFFGRKMRAASTQIYEAQSELSSLVNDQVRGVATVKSLGSELSARWRFEEALVNTLRARYDFSLTSIALGSVDGYLSTIINVSLWGLAIYMSINQGMTPGQVIASNMLAHEVIGPFAGLASAWAEFQQLRVTIDRLNDVFMAESENRPSSRALVKQRLRGEIEFRDVWFQYKGDSSNWVLKGMTFHILPGQSVAIVGHNGCGKSTLSMLAARLYEPQKGVILLDGRDYRDYDRQWVRTQIGLMLQESQLFYGTIGENIAYGDPKADPARIQAAAEDACAHDFIIEKQGGYDYRILHGGLGLSGGEKQRIAIARRLYTDPPILFLDEATSVLDVEAERNILTRLKSKGGARTVISIAHRYATVRNADYVLVFHGGRVEESGTHDQLMAKKGHYHKIFAGQMETM